MSGLNLVKGGFPAKEGRSKAQIGRTSARCAGRNAPHGAPGRRKVRRKSVPRRCKRTGGVHPSAQAVPSGQHAWSHGKHEFWVCVPAPLGSSPSVYLAEFLRFARLRPSRSEGEPITTRRRTEPERYPSTVAFRKLSKPVQQEDLERLRSCVSCPRIAVAQ
jgi:hypothetical protein